MDKEILLSSTHVIAYRAELVDVVGSIEAALILQQLCHWNQFARRADGFIYKTAAELYEETRVTEKKLRSVRKALIDAGFIEVKKAMANGANTYHYRVLVNIATVLTPVGLQGSTSSTGPGPERNSQNASTITKNTHENNTYVDFDEDIKKLYKGWLIEFIIGSDVWLKADAETRSTLIEAAERKVKLTPKRRQKLGLRTKNLGFLTCARAIKKLAQSEFHRGHNDNNWKATLEWLFNSDEKVEEWSNR